MRDLFIVFLMYLCFLFMIVLCSQIKDNQANMEMQLTRIERILSPGIDMTNMEVSE